MMVNSETSPDNTAEINSQNFQRALKTVEGTLDKLTRCSAEEQQSMRVEFSQLRSMMEKLDHGQVEIVVFGEISTGKSALINALVGEAVAEVDVQGGWTKEVWRVDWEGSGYVLPGFADSRMVLVDTPGLNEVGGADRADMAREAAQRADVILFVTDSDLNETEHSALSTLASAHKPIIVVLNKMDLYSQQQRDRLFHVLREERLAELVPSSQLVATMADPREVEVVIESSDGKVRSEWRKPEPDVEQLKARILQVLDREGLALVALNAAMYAADKSDRIATMRIEFRDRQARKTIWGYAAFKSVAVGVNVVPLVDVLAGGAVDVSMVITLAHIYGLDLSWKHAQKLVSSIAKNAGLVGLISYASVWAGSAFKAVTGGLGMALTAVPQGAAAGWGSYIVGNAAKYYFEHGASWGNDGPKAVVKRILDQTDKDSILAQLKDEIRQKLNLNPHARDAGSPKAE